MAHRHTGKKLALSAALLAAAGTVLGVGSFAAWTAQTTNPNSIAAGTLSMTNSDGCGAPVSGSSTCTAILNATALKPGGTTTGSVTIVNTGTLAGTYTLTESGSAAAVCGDMTLKVDTGVPVVYNGALNALPSTALGNLAASGGSQTYNFTVTLSNAAPQSDEGLTCAVNFIWTAVPA